ncbi:MAG TPA: hypothetical protein VN944_05725 [Nitrospiria bacterium]|nr:hypothetical protein [Nitrospiria bacterium]
MQIKLQGIYSDKDNMLHHLNDREEWEAKMAGLGETYRREITEFLFNERILGTWVKIKSPQISNEWGKGNFTNGPIVITNIIDWNSSVVNNANSKKLDILAKKDNHIIGFWIEETTMTES